MNIALNNPFGSASNSRRSGQGQRRATRNEGAITGELVKFLNINRGWVSEATIRIELKKTHQLEHDVEPELLERLKQKANVEYKANCYRYLPTHPHRHNWDSIVELLRETPAGIPWRDLHDAYPGVEQDLQALVAQRKVMRVWDQGAQAPILYAREADIKMPVETDVKRLWREVKLPDQASKISDELESKKLSFFKETIVQQGTRKRKKKSKRKRTRRQHLANSHLVQDYQWLNTDQNKKEGEGSETKQSKTAC